MALDVVCPTLAVLILGGFFFFFYIFFTIAFLQKVVTLLYHLMLFPGQGDQLPALSYPSCSALGSKVSQLVG